MNTYEVWTDDMGPSEPMKAWGPCSAAEQWCEESELDGQWTQMDVTVKNVETGEIVLLTVHREFEPSFTALARKFSNEA